MKFCRLPTDRLCRPAFGPGQTHIKRPVQFSFARREQVVLSCRPPQNSEIHIVGPTKPPSSNCFRARNSCSGTAARTQAVLPARNCRPSSRPVHRPVVYPVQHIETNGLDIASEPSAFHLHNNATRRVLGITETAPMPEFHLITERQGDIFRAVRCEYVHRDT